MKNSTYRDILDNISVVLINKYHMSEGEAWMAIANSPLSEVFAFDPEAAAHIPYEELAENVYNRRHIQAKFDT